MDVLFYLCCHLTDFLVLRDLLPSFPAPVGVAVVLEPAQLVDVPLVEAVEGHVAEEQVARTLRRRLISRQFKPNPTYHWANIT